MASAYLALPVGISRRIEKLAKEAGKTPDQMLKFVLRDGLGHTEYAVKEANAGIEELDAGKGVSLDQIRKNVTTRQNNAPKFIPTIRPFL
jgi:predicted transcriptional regulator